MASIAIMIGGAVLNAAAFTGGNYLAKYLAGDDGQAALAEKTRHDKALGAYQAAMAKYTRERTQLFDHRRPKLTIRGIDQIFMIYLRVSSET